MRRFVFHLAAAGYRVIAYDQPAHGLSDGRLTGLPDFADVLAEVARHHGNVRAVIAHSLGGPATAIALARGLTAERAVLISPPSDLLGFSRRFARWLDWTLQTTTPGGCIMISAAHEYDDRPGPIRDAAVEMQRRGIGVSERAVRLAIEEGHLKKDTDPEQIAFEMLGIVLASHNHGRLLGDKAARRRALAAFDALVARHAAPAQPRLRAASR